MRDEALQLLKLDPAREVDRICARMRQVLSTGLRRQGAVVGISGGIDSSVTAALAAHALGSQRVLALMMPDRDSSPETERLSRTLAGFLGIGTAYVDITPTLEAVGCYQRRDEAYRRVIPDYGEGWLAKIVLPTLTENSTIRFFTLVARSPDGTEVRRRLPAREYLQIVAATNFKQRVRKMFEYHHADCNNFAVLGTPNRLEYDQGFFVKLGDGAADIKPIAHLYKTQVYQLADYLGIPADIVERPPTTDTYSLAQSQEEFYFSLPFDQMDLAIFAKDSGLTPCELSELLEISEGHAKSIYADIDQKRRTAEYLHAGPALLTPDVAAPAALRQHAR